jgi:hypothetical protein
MQLRGVGQVAHDSRGNSCKRCTSRMIGVELRRGDTVGRHDSFMIALRWDLAGELFWEEEGWNVPNKMPTDCGTLAPSWQVW